MQDLQLVNDTTSDQQIARLTNNQADIDQNALENEPETSLTLSNLQPSLAAIDGVPSSQSNSNIHIHSPQTNPTRQMNNQMNNGFNNALTTLNTHQSSPFIQSNPRTTTSTTNNSIQNPPSDYSSTSSQHFSHSGHQQQPQ